MRTAADPATTKQAAGRPPAPPQALPLGQRLVSNGVVTEDQLRIALLEQRRTRQPVGKILVELGFVTEAMMREVLSSSFGLQDIDLARLTPDPRALELIPKQLAETLRVFPVSRSDEVLEVALSNPNDLTALDQIRASLTLPLRIELRLASESDILRAIDQFYGISWSIDGILHEIETGEIDTQSLQVTGREYTHPVVRLIDSILTDAVRRGASDIHFEPESVFLRIRYRIDGVMRQVRAIHRKYWPAMAVRLKVLADMNLAETRAAQDGRITATLVGRQIDFRVAAQPTVHGENFVLRLLDRQRALVNIDQLGLSDTQLRTLMLMLARPEGIILVTGPTGSGKTTTLYSILQHVNTEAVNIMTLEDPVEYPLPMVRQTSLHDAVKIDFANGIRSLMRQDPDIILVGEIRDRETADMALRAAMTGHQVFSTLHANSALAAVIRLLDLGVSADVIAGNLIGTIAQRLVRKLCTHCKQAATANDDELQILGLPAASTQTIYKPVGCVRCDHQGYKGRLALMEIVRFEARLDALVARRAPLSELRQTARNQGCATLADDGCRRVLEGLTSLDEVARVVDLTDRVLAEPDLPAAQPSADAQPQPELIRLDRRPGAPLSLAPI